MSLTLERVARLLYDEAALLDEARYDDWLALYADDAVYWVPNEPGATDPTREVSIVYDDRRRLEERVWRLTSGYAYAQMPASRTTRIVANVRLLEEEATGPDEVVVASALVVHELRRESRVTYSGQCRHTLRLVDDAPRIASKRIDLIDAAIGLGNVSIIL